MWTFARKILLHDRIKFAVASAGVSISVLLVLVQVGLYFGFMQNASALIDHSDADVWVTAKANENFDFAAPLDERAAYRVAEEPGVARMERVILAFGQKDTKGQKGIGEYYIVERSGDLTQLGKQEAYDHLEREERGGRPDEAPPELTNPLAGFSDEEIRAEFLRRKLKVRG